MCIRYSITPSPDSFLSPHFADEAEKESARPAPDSRGAYHQLMCRTLSREEACNGSHLKRPGYRRRTKFTM